MSFLSDAFEGNFSHLGTDLSHAGSSLMSHPSELYETLGGAAALATGGLALGALPELGAAGAAAEGGGMLGGLFGGGADAAAAGGVAGAADTAGALGYGTAVADPIAAAVPGLEGAGSGLGTAAGGASGAGGAAPGAFDIGAAQEGSGIVQGIASNPAYSGAPPGNFVDTLTSPSQWTLPGVGKGLGVAAAGAGLGMNLMRGNQMDPNQQKLSDLAGQLGSQGQVLESYLKTGKLPPALQTQLDQAKAAEKARIISGYAQRGLPTDPKLNSGLTQDLNNVDTNAIAAMAQVQVNMLNTGLKETGMSMELYQMLTQLDMKQNEDLMKSISSFAAALGGGFGGSPARMA